MTLEETRKRSAVTGPPALVIFDVNETLSDMSPLHRSFEQVGLESNQVEAWFSGVLRDGFALTAVGVNRGFAELASEALRVRLGAIGGESEQDLEEAVDEVMSTFMALDVHPDVVDGLNALRQAGRRLGTLSNGSATVAERLFERAGVSGVVERVLSVEDANLWKPHPSSYAYALEVFGVAAQDAMLVAVHPWDINGAARAGLRTGWLNRKSARYPSYFRAAEVEAGDLVSLARVLG